MQTPYSKTRLAAAQDDLWLAEIEREDATTLVITLAGPGRIVALECTGLRALALAYESLDPEILPKSLVVDPPMELGQVTEFDPDEEIPARLRPVEQEQVEDILAASQHAWLDGRSADLENAPLLLDLRVESWRLDPHPADLHLLIACDQLLAADEKGELAITGDELPDDHHDDEPAPPYAAPQEPAFTAAPGLLPDDIHKLMKSFFEAGLRDDFAALAEMVQSFDLSRDEQTEHYACHFHNLFDWGFARAEEGWEEDGDLACARIRGIIHSREEDGISAINEECVWSFSLRKTAEGWTIRNWSTSWPSVGGCPDLSDDEKPWLADWQSGSVI